MIAPSTSSRRQRADLTSLLATWRGRVSRVWKMMLTEPWSLPPRRFVAAELYSTLRVNTEPLVKGARPANCTLTIVLNGFPCSWRVAQRLSPPNGETNRAKLEPRGVCTYGRRRTLRPESPVVMTRPGSPFYCEPG